MIFLPLETELFYYEHLLDSTDNLQLIKDFFVRNPSGQGLERYIKELAESDEKDGSARTYLVKDKFTHEIVAYFSIKNGLFTIDAGNGYFYSIPSKVFLEAMYLNGFFTIDSEVDIFKGGKNEELKNGKAYSKKSENR